MIGDPAGDANFVNDGGESESGNQPTATSEPALDLRRVEVAPARTGGSTTGFGCSSDRTPLSDPFQRQIGTSMVDTTLQDVSYRMR